MFDYTVGRPKKCCNLNCKTPFFKESFEGYLPLNSSYVLCIMKCPKCHYKFAIKQAISMVDGYLNTLPSKPKPKKKVSMITDKEMQEVRQAMNDKDILKMLVEED